MHKYEKNLIVQVDLFLNDEDWCTLKTMVKMKFDYGNIPKNRTEI